MRIRGQQLLWVFAFVAVTNLAQSTIQSAIRNPQFAMPSSAWRSLFDGASLKDWRGYKTDVVPEGWKIVKGALSKDGHVGDLISKDEFGDFELELAWKIGEAGNSGIFYRGVEDFDFRGRPNDDRIYTTAPEYQLLDDIKAEDNKTPLTRAGANYGLYPAAP